MPERIFNFNPGPATLPYEVLKEAGEAVVNFQNLGMSVLEVSHRSKEYDAVHNEAIALMKQLFFVPEGYHVLFLGGGVSLQFAMIPMNCLGEGETSGLLDRLLTRVSAEGARRRHLFCRLYL